MHKKFIYPLIKKPLTSVSSLFLFILTLVVNLSCSQSTIPELKTGSQQPMPTQWIDQETGHEVTRLTDTSGDNRSFYFHNNPFIPDTANEGNLMLFYGSDQQRLSDRWYKGDDIKQLFSINLKTNKITQLTNHLASIHGEIVGPERREAFYQSKDSVFAVSVDNQHERLIYVFPDTMHKARITTLNANETLLAGTFSSPKKDSILNNNPKKTDFFKMIYYAKLPHTIFTLNIENGEIEYIHSDTAWLNHVQFSPIDPNNLGFCHEGPWQLVDRIWNIDINEKKPKLLHKRTVPMEIAGHEFFSRDGQTMWFDLQIPIGETFYLAGVNLNTDEKTRYAMTRNEWSVHFNISPDQQTFAGDGGDESQVAHAKDGKWIYHFIPEGDSLQSTKLVDMSNHDYDLEPNVHFTPDGEKIIFRANFEGKSQIYAVDVKK